MGRVLRARDVQMDVDVAIKVVRSELASDPGFRQLFEQEIRAAARLAHPRIVPVHDAGELPSGVPYLALAFADGGSVASWVRSPRPWALVRQMALELLEALAFVHAAGALHRDIKPANVLLHGASGRVWLADLGLAGHTGELVRGERRTEGTPGYMAPEQAAGRIRELCPASDLFAVGVVLWQLVTGKRPFGREARALDQALPPLIPQPGLSIPEGLDRLLANLLAVDPLARYDLAADVITELGALGQPSITAASSPTVARPGVVVAARAEASVSSMTSSAPADAGAGGLLDLATWNRPLPPSLPAQVPPPRPSEPSRASLTLFTLRDPPLVGQQTARQVLWDAARAVVAEQRSHCVVVQGPMGSGKTHLVRSVTRVLHQEGFAEPCWLTSTRLSGEEDGFQGAVRRWLRPWDDDQGGVYNRLVRRIARARGRIDNRTCSEAAELSQWACPEPGEPAVPDAVALREVYRRLDALSWRGLSVLVLDGADYANTPGDGLQFAENALRSDDAPCLIIVTVGEEADLAALVGLGATVLPMPSLARRDARKLLDAWLPLEPALAEAVVERCDGDAGLSRDVVMSWAEQGWLQARGPIWALKSGVDPHAALPAHGVELALARLDVVKQPIAARRALATLALMGASLPRQRAETLCGEHLDALLVSGVLELRGPRVAFESSRTYEATRAWALSLPDAPQLFERLLEAAGPSDGLLERGEWALGAGDRLLACELLGRAADVNLEAGRLGRADRAAQQLLQATTGREPYFGARGQAWLAWGRAGLARGELDAARERLVRSERRLLAAEDDEALAALDASLGELLALSGDLDAAAKRLGRGEDRAQTAALPAWRVRACRLRAAVEFSRRNTDGAEVLYRRAEGLAADVGLVREEAASVLGQAKVALAMGLLTDADEAFEEARRTFERARDPVGAVEAAVGRASVLSQRGRLAPAIKAARRATERADRLGLAVLGLRARGVHAAALARSGELESAHRLWQHVLDWATSIGDFEGRVHAMEALIWGALDARDLRRAYTLLGEMGESLKPTPGHAGWSRYRFVGAAYLQASGNADGAQGWLWDAMELGLGDRCDIQTANRLRRMAEQSEHRAPAFAELAHRALKRVVALSDLAETGLF